MNSNFRTNSNIKFSSIKPFNGKVVNKKDISTIQNLCLQKCDIYLKFAIYELNCFTPASIKNPTFARSNLEFIISNLNDIRSIIAEHPEHIDENLFKITEIAIHNHNSLKDFKTLDFDFLKTNDPSKTLIFEPNFI